MPSLRKKAKKQLSKAAGEETQEDSIYDDLDLDDEDEISHDIAESLRDLDPDGDGKF